MRFDPGLLMFDLEHPRSKTDFVRRDELPPIIVRLWKV
jgi:hypothetical protein